MSCKPSCMSSIHALDNLYPPCIPNNTRRSKKWRRDREAKLQRVPEPISLSTDGAPTEDPEPPGVCKDGGKTTLFVYAKLFAKIAPPGAYQKRR